MLVGYDGSPDGRRAVEWAAQEAGRGGGVLRVLLAYQVGIGARLLPDERADRVAVAQAAGLADFAVAAARMAAPGVEVHGTTVRGHATAALLDAAVLNRLVVVGHRGAGGFHGLRVGAVGLRVATHAPCPVAVVRGVDRPGGPVVVGADGSEAAPAAVALGFEQAAARRTRLVVARAGLHDPAGSGGPARELSPWLARYPEVPVSFALSAGSATDLLVGLADVASLVVVDGSGPDGTTGPRLGSTTQQLICSAGCPVLVARPAGVG
ncbi:universal stress protein [Virgisporangium ochraceum]|uniref:Universal stress protein n=1 Tax=Virgisporangium ochraceum TaxID=65505 RepID=A0A8J3ZWV9_9ACTN|nr:universal stress protein [Virgisporangium ochraceum]GIJ71549.1 universal stress protein [Virgisporangium ochraceum]